MAAKLHRRSSFNKLAPSESEMRPRSNTWSIMTKKPPKPRRESRDTAGLRELVLSKSDKHYLHRKFKLDRKHSNENLASSVNDEQVIKSLDKQIKAFTIGDATTAPPPKSILKKPISRSSSADSDSLLNSKRNSRDSDFDVYAVPLKRNSHSAGSDISDDPLNSGQLANSGRSTSQFHLNELEKPTSLMFTDGNGNVLPIGRRRASVDSDMILSPSNIRHMVRDELVDCAICLDRLKVPKMLRCMHSFCLHCLHDLAVKRRFVTSFPCPVCRETVIIPDGGIENLPTNVYALKLLELVPAKPVQKRSASVDSTPSSCATPSPPNSPGVFPESFVKRKNFCGFKVPEPVRDIAFKPDNGTLAVLCGDAIKMYDLSGHVCKKIRHLSMIAPCRVALNGSLIAVIDKKAHDVKVFSHDGTLLAKSDSDLYNPVCLAIRSKNEIFVADEDGKVHILDKKLKHVSEFLVKNVRKPSHMHFSERGDLYISDSWDNEVKAFDCFGNVKFMYSPRNVADESMNPMSTDSSGIVFIADYVRSRVHMLDTNGRFCGSLLTKGEGVYRPVAIATSSCGYLALAEGNGNIKVYKYLK